MITLDIGGPPAEIKNLLPRACRWMLIDHLQVAVALAQRSHVLVVAQPPSTQGPEICRQTEGNSY